MFWICDVVFIVDFRVFCQWLLLVDLMWVWCLVVWYCLFLVCAVGLVVMLRLSPAVVGWLMV